MLRKNKLVWLILFLLIGAGLACDQSDDANKLVDEANALISKNNELITKSTELDKGLLGAGSENESREFETFKDQNKAKFDELTSLNDEIEKLGRETLEKFEQAAKLQLDDKNFKNYLDLNVEEMKKRVEFYEFNSKSVKDFLAAKDAEAANKIIEDFNVKSEKLRNEYTELSEKAAKVITDNPGSFGQSAQ